MANILIIDDSNFSRLTIRKYLEEAGHIVVGEAENGEIGLELYKQLSPDLVTMDMLMPVCDGITSLKSILKYDSKAKIIICTEIGQQNVGLRSIQLGAKNFAVKPIHKEHFLEVIGNTLNDKKVQSKDKKPELDEQAITKQLSFDNILIKNPNETYTLSLVDDSLKDIGFLRKDFITIDKLIKPNINDMVLVSVNNNFVIGYYKKDNGKDIEIEPANKEKYKIICDKEHLVGVIIGLVRKLRD